MAFDWKALAERADPRKWNWSWVTPARNWAVANRATVLSTSIALLVGLWGGAVLGRVGTGLPAFDFAQLGTIGAGGSCAQRQCAACRPAASRRHGVRAPSRRDEPGRAARVPGILAKSLDRCLGQLRRLYRARSGCAVPSRCVRQSFLPGRPAVRAGAPSSRSAKACRPNSGDRTEYDETFTLTFGDRPAYVGFAGGGVILPRSEADGIAIETVNVSRLAVEVLRVPDRILSQYQLEQGETNEEGGWGYWSFDNAGENVGVQVYEGDHRHRRRVRAETPLLPRFSRLALRSTSCGQARTSSKFATIAPSAGQRARRATTKAVASSYRWILYTDMALQSFSGATGLDVVVRSLRTARPLSEHHADVDCREQRRTGAHAHRSRRPRAFR